MSYASLARRWPAVALAMVVALFLAYSLPPYLTGKTRVPATFAWHYPLLVAHVLLGSVVMVAAIAQIWPRTKTRHPALHRAVGRVYVGSAIPAALCAMVIGAATPFGPFLAVSNVLLAATWLWFTVAGFVAARRRRIADHRRRMTLSVVLALSTITNRIWTPLFLVVLHPLQDSLFGGDETHFLWFAAGLGAWLGWTLPFVTALWWLRHAQKLSSSSIHQLQHTSRV